MPTPSYWLPKHVYLCATQGDVVFLDLRRDKYLGLGGPQREALTAVVQGWPPSPAPIAPEKRLTRDEAIEVADLLVAEGLLTKDESRGKQATPVVMESAEILSAVGQDGESRRGIRLLDIFNFVQAYFEAFWLLRCRSFERAVRRVEDRKRRSAKSPTHLDLSAATELVGIFALLRTYTFTSRDECLFYAMVLVNFLSKYALFPTWVVGVRTCPFAAHSWVQHGSWILGDSPEETCFYTPIVAI